MWLVEVWLKGTEMADGEEAVALHWDWMAEKYVSRNNDLSLGNTVPKNKKGQGEGVFIYSTWQKTWA